MTAYANGTRFEQQVKEHLEGNGYWAVRAAGSHGCADVVGIKAGEVLLVQCKSGATQLSHDEWNGLYLIAYGLTSAFTSVLPLVADRPVRGRIRYRRITSGHIPRSHLWPAYDWTPDPIGDAA